MSLTISLIAILVNCIYPFRKLTAKASDFLVQNFDLFDLTMIIIMLKKQK